MINNTKASYRGFKSTNWNNKTDRQKVKTLKNQYEKLGYKIPQYLQGNKISDKQFNSALNKIDKAYQRRIEKEQPKIKMSDIQYNANKYNKLVDTRLKQLKTQGFSDKAINYIQGKLEFTTLGDRAIFANNSLLEKIQLDNVKANQKGRKAMIDIIDLNYSKLKSKNYIDNILNSSKNVPFLNEFLNSETFNNLDDDTKHHIIRKFESLNIVQQEALIQNELNRLREKYENSGELDYKHTENLASNITKSIDDIVKEI